MMLINGLEKSERNRILTI